MSTTEYSQSCTPSHGTAADRWTAVCALVLILTSSGSDVAVANPFLDDDLIDIVHTGYIGDVYHQGFWKSTIGVNLDGANGYAIGSFYFYLPDEAQADGTNTSVRSAGQFDGHGPADVECQHHHVRGAGQSDAQPPCRGAPLRLEYHRYRA